MVLIERLFLICVLTSVVHSVPECTFPAVFQSSTWTDSDHGELQFSTDTMAGWTAEYTSNKNSFVVTTIDQWECFYVLSNATSTTLIVKATGTFVYDGSGTLKFRPYLCMEMTSISNVSYYYYLQWGEQTNLNNHPRVTVMPDTTVITDPHGQLCDSVTTTNEYHVIVKQGFAASAVQMCSSDYYGIYSYAISTGVDSDTNVMCNDGTERWNVCEDKYMMKITYSTCSTPIGSSASGSLSCLATLQSGSYTLQTVYDNDADVTSPQDRFTCFMSSLSNDGSLTVSQSPHSCTKTQTPFAQPVLNNGTTVGLTLALTPIPNGLCPITTTTTTTTTTTVTSGNSPASSASSSSGSTSTGVIVGATIGSLAALAAIAALLICCLYGKFRSRRRDNQIASTPVHSDKNALHIEADDDSERGRHTDDKTKANPKPHSDKWDERIEPIAGKAYTAQDFSSILTNSTDTSSNTCTTVHSIEDIKQDIMHANLLDIVEDFNTARIEGDPESQDSNDIEVIRVVSKPPVMTNDEPHLNSTENIFSRYDPAMSYASKSTWRPEKSVPPISMWSLRSKQAKTTSQDVRLNTFEITRDDSGIDVSNAFNAKTLRLNKSEGNLLQLFKNEKQGINEKTKTTFRSDSIEWSFIYHSPYAMSLEEKEAALERRKKLQKKKMRAMKRKHAEEVKRKRESAEAYENWKRRKVQEKREQMKKMETLSAADKFYQYKSWMPL